MSGESVASESHLCPFRRAGCCVFASLTAWTDPCFMHVETPEPAATAAEIPRSLRSYPHGKIQLPPRTSTWPVRNAAWLVSSAVGLRACTVGPAVGLRACTVGPSCGTRESSCNAGYRKVSSTCTSAIVSCESRYQQVRGVRKLNQNHDKEVQFHSKYAQGKLCHTGTGPAAPAAAPASCRRGRACPASTAISVACTPGRRSDAAS